MGYAIKDLDINVLRSAGVSEDDIAHSVKVAEKALDLARRIRGTGIDQELVGRGALFHDLGKAKTHEMEHGIIGAELGKVIGLPDEITSIMEKHIRGGLSEAEARELGLPVKDYTLRKLEERIVIYADRLVDIITDGIVPISSEQEAESRFEEILRTYPNYGKNATTLERYLGYHREIQGLVKRPRTITPGELRERSAEFTVIDVRRTADYDGTAILNAEWQDPEKVDEWAASLPAGKEIVLYCARGGSVSNKVLDSLLSANVAARYIEGGIDGWKRSGGPVARKSGKGVP